MGQEAWEGSTAEANRAWWIPQELHKVTLPEMGVKCPPEIGYSQKSLLVGNRAEGWVLASAEHGVAAAGGCSEARSQALEPGFSPYRG